MGYGTNWEFPNSSLRMNAQIDAVGLNSDAGVMLHLDAAWAGHRGTFLYGIGLEGDVIHSPGAINPSPEDALIEDIDGHTDFSSIRKAYARIGFQWADGDQSLTLSGPLIGARPGLAVTDDVLGSSPTPWGTFPYETSSRTAGFVGQYTLRHTPVALDIRVVAGSGGTSLNFEHPDTMTFWDGWNLSGDANLSVTVGDFVLGAMASFGRVLSGSNEGSAAYGVAGGIHWGIRRWLNLDAAYRYVRNVDNTGVERDDHTVAAQASGVLYRSSGNFEARYGVRGSYHSASGEDEVCPNDDPMCAGSGTVEGDTFEGFNSRYLIGNRGVEFLVNIDLCWAQVCLGGTIGTIATAQPGDDLSARLFWGIRFGTNGAPLAERTSSSPSRANRPERAERPEQEENDDSVGEDGERAEEEEAEEEVAAETDDSNSWR